MLFQNRLNCRVLLTSVIVLSFGITSCSQAEQKKNQVSIDGGAVGFPIHQAVAEEFQKVKPDAQVSVASSGTGGGMSKFCAGEIDIVGASRSIKDEEIERCKKKDIDFVELPIALDGIAVIVNRKNDFAKCLTLKEIKNIWNSKSTNKITNWNQVNPKFPNQHLKASRTSDLTAFFNTEIDETGKRRGKLVEFSPTEEIFSSPKTKEAKAYISGQFG